MNEFIAVGLGTFAGGWLLGWFANELRQARKELDREMRENAAAGIGTSGSTIGKLGFTGEPSMRSTSLDPAFLKGLQVDGNMCHFTGVTAKGTTHGSSPKNLPKWTTLVLVLCIPVAAVLGLLIGVVATALDSYGLLTEPMRSVVNASGGVITLIILLIFLTSLVDEAIRFFKGEV